MTPLAFGLCCLGFTGMTSSVPTRATQENFEIADEEAFKKFLVENEKSEWFETVIKPKKTVIKKEVEYSGDSVVDSKTGAIVDGLVATPATVTAEVKIKEERDENGNLVLYPIPQLYVYKAE